MSLSINEVNSGGIAILELHGRLDTNTATTLEKSALQLACGKLLLDCGDLNYVSSAGLRVLLMAAKKAKKEGGKVVLTGLSESVQEVFDISGFSSLFVICATRDDGLAAF